jgi:carbonic anhydrase
MPAAGGDVAAGADPSRDDSRTGSDHPPAGNGSDRPAADTGSDPHGGTGTSAGADVDGSTGTGPEANADRSPGADPGTDVGRSTAAPADASTGPGIATHITRAAGTSLGAVTGAGAGATTGTTTDPHSHPHPIPHELARGISSFQRNTAPLVRDELARLAREGQRPSQLFLTCADSRLVTSMITSSGPGDLFVVRNVGNLVPPPGEEHGDDSVAAAIEYAVDVLRVRSITVCGHSGCGAMQALLTADPGGVMTPLKRWLRHGLPSLERMAGDLRAWPRLAGRSPADVVEQLCLTNVVQQLEHLRAHGSVARALAAGALELHGMYFHVGEAQAYLLRGVEDGTVFEDVKETEEVQVHGPT